MNKYLKILPLLTLLGTSISYAADATKIKDLKTSNQSTELTKTAPNEYLGVEIQEIIIRDTSKTFEDIEKALKETKDPVTLNNVLLQFGPLTESNTYYFSNVNVGRYANFANRSSRSFINDYTTKEILGNGTTDKLVEYKTDSSTSGYSFDLRLDHLNDNKYSIFITGETTDQYRTTLQNETTKLDSKNNANINNYSQTSLLTLNEYQVISSTSKNVENLNKEKETRILMVKITKD